MSIDSTINDVVSQLVKTATELSKGISKYNILEKSIKIESIKELEACIEIFLEAKQSFFNDKDTGKFLVAFSMASMMYGEIFGRVVHCMYLSNQKSEYSKKRLKNDPKQLAKTEIEKQYQESKTQFNRHGFSAQFCRDMHQKYPVITDIKTIERLVSKLNKVNDEIPPKQV